MKIKERFERTAPFLRPPLLPCRVRCAASGGKSARMVAVQNLPKRLAAPERGKKCGPFLSGRLLETELFSISRYEHGPVPHRDPSEEQWNGWHIVFTEADRWHYRDGYGRGEITARMAVLGAPRRFYRCRHEEEIPSDSCLDFEFRNELACGLGLEERAFSSSVLRVTPRLLMLKESLKRMAVAGCEGACVDELAEALLDEACLALGRPAAASPRGGGEKDRVAAAREFMRRHFAEKLSLADLAAAVGLSRFHFTRIFRDHSGATPYSYLRTLRLDNAALLLRETAVPVTNIAYDCGFSSLSLFINAFNARFGISPSEYRVSFGK